MRNFISNIIAGVIAAALDSINTALNPVLIASIIALVLLGICLGWLLRGLLVWRPKRRIQSEDANKHNREVIMQLDEANKRLLKASYFVGLKIGIHIIGHMAKTSCSSSLSMKPFRDPELDSSQNPT